MYDKQSWDWTTELKEISLKKSNDQFNWVEDPCISSDGERIANIVNIDEMSFGIQENMELWDGEYEKAWSLKTIPYGGFVVCVCQNEEWTLSINGKEWENKFDFIWNVQINQDGSKVGLTFQQDMQYGMAVNDFPWENRFENISGTIMGDTGAVAGVVQIISMGSADIETFSKNIFAVSLNGNVFNRSFLNIWDISFDQENKNIAYTARLNRDNYTIVVNDTPWNNNFQSAWKPIFVGDKNSVLAPVLQKGKWWLFKNNKKFWTTGFNQLWHLTFSQSGNKVAAIVAPSYGKWSVVEDEDIWPLSVDIMISDIKYSQNGKCLVAIAKDNKGWTLIVDKKKWKLSCDKLFDPCISSDGSVVAATIEQDGKYYVVVNDKTITEPFEYIVDPVISPDNKKVLVKGIKNEIYKRQVISI